MFWVIYLIAIEIRSTKWWQHSGKAKNGQKRESNDELFIATFFFVPFVHFWNKIISSFNLISFSCRDFREFFCCFLHAFVSSSFERIKWKMNKMSPWMLFFLFLFKQKSFARQKAEKVFIFIFNILSCCHSYFIHFLCLSPSSREVEREKWKLTLKICWKMLWVESETSNEV